VEDGWNSELLLLLLTIGLLGHVVVERLSSSRVFSRDVVSSLRAVISPLARSINHRETKRHVNIDLRTHSLATCNTNSRQVSPSDISFN